MAAQILMRRGRTSVSAIIKGECCRQNGQQLNDLLEYLLEPSRPIDDSDTLDWCRCLIAGGQAFDEFSKTVRQYDSATTCGLVWTANFVAYRCKTCSVSPCMSLCSDCFQAGDHVGHDYNMFRSQAGGACDCGDVSVMNPAGFCPRHGPDRVSQLSGCPDDLVAVAEAMMPKIFLRLLYHLRDNTRPEMNGTYQIAMQEAEGFLSFLHSLCDMGAAMRKVITKALTDTQYYNTVTQVEEKEDGSNRYYVTSQNNYMAAVAMMRFPHGLEDYEDLPGLSQTLKHDSLLEEMVFWMVKYEFPQKIVTLLLSLLPHDKYKEAFTRAFVKHYSRISLVLVNTIDRMSVANRVVHISVQLFSNESLSKKMAEELNLVYILVLGLTRMVENMLSESYLQDPDHNFHMVVDCGHGAMKDHCYWPIVSDLINLLSHKSIAEQFMSDDRLVKLWLEMVAYFQGMNLNQRELTQHVEFEPDTYYAAFSAELEIAASPMWALLSHCKDKDSVGLSKLIIRACTEAIQDWFDAINCTDSTKPNPHQLTFHLPLHRYMATFLVQAIQHQQVAPESILPSERMLKSMMMHPLQIQVGIAEIYCGLWVRNGLQIKGQAMTYVQCHFCYSMVDADIFLLQICGSRLPPDFFIQTVLDRFHVQNWLSLDPHSPSVQSNLNEEHELAMVEGALCFLAMLQSVNRNLGMEEKELTRLEMSTLLAVADRTHSQLMDLMPEKSGMTGMSKELFESILKEIADYKAPNFEAGGGMQQGTYVPKDHLWDSDFDPLHVLLRAVHRKDFQSAMDRYAEHLKVRGKYKSKSPPWPPFKLPGSILPQYNGLRKLLHCKTLHGFIFTILFKATREPSFSETILYFCVYLLELAISLPPVDATNKTISIPDKVHDCQYTEWFPSNHISFNVRHTVKEVLIPAAQVNTDSDPLMTVAMETSSLEEMFHLAPATITSSGGPITSAHTGMLPCVSATVSPATTTGVPLASFREPSKPKYESKGVSTDSLAPDFVTVPVNESMVSLLMKLHSKLSGKNCYVPESGSRQRSSEESGACAPDPDLSRTGDGPQFVGMVLNKIARLSSDCCKHVETVYRERCPVAETSRPSRKNETSDQEERRKKARQRQQKLMEQFASKQKAFMEQNMDTEDFGTERTGSSPETSRREEERFDCVICNQSSPSSRDRPMGLVVLLQSTSVLGHRVSIDQPKTLPVGEGKRTPARSTPCSVLYNRRLDKMLEHFEEGHCQMSVSIGWEGGVHVQSCGHYLHLDCHSSYIESLKTQAPSPPFNVGKGEYGCPLCRQLANSVIPMVPEDHTSLVKPLSHDPMQMVYDLAELMVKRPITPGSSTLTKAMGSMMEDLTNSTYPAFKTYTKSPTSESVLLFVCSVARTNLELELLQRGGNLGTTTTVAKKASFLPLMQVLAMHSKILITSPYTDLWSHITGVPYEVADSNSVQPYRVGVPLLLKDLSSVLIQLIHTLPTHIHKEHYVWLVRMLYNVVFIQSLTILSCKFSEEERAAWRTKGRQVKSSMLESLLSHMITRLECSRLYEDADLDIDQRISAICQSVWSPHCVESMLQDHCLPFLRMAGLIKYHMFGEDIPMLQQKQTEFQMLMTYLEIPRRESGATPAELTTAQCVQWVITEPMTLTRAWTMDLVNFVNNHPADAKNLLLVNPVWYGPRLMVLPHQYYKIFQHYRNKQCLCCSNVPKDPAICLVCGRFLCFKQACCSYRQRSSFECVEHSIECGAGTGIYLLVNSSVIVVVRGPRATLWGSVYLDDHGEEDRDLKRGKPLYLSVDRLKLLENQWISHTFDHACKRWILHHDRL